VCPRPDHPPRTPERSLEHVHHQRAWDEPQGSAEQLPERSIRPDPRQIDHRAQCSPERTFDANGPRGVLSFDRRGGCIIVSPALTRYRPAASPFPLASQRRDPEAPDPQSGSYCLDHLRTGARTPARRDHGFRAPNRVTQGHNVCIVNRDNGRDTLA